MHMRNNAFVDCHYREMCSACTHDGVIHFLYICCNFVK
jgi:hypothetical protein